MHEKNKTHASEILVLRTDRTVSNLSAKKLSKRNKLLTKKSVNV
jgi:hypothetical protein